MYRKLFFLTSFVLVLALAGTNTVSGAVTWEGRIISSSDDREHYVGGAIDAATSSDLEMPYEDAGKGRPQVVGLRFVNVAIPPGSNITKAYVEFTCDETKDGSLPVSLIIEGEPNPNPPTFTTDIIGRPRTTAKVVWNPVNWTTVGQKDKTTDISSIIREVIGLPGWASGNALVLIISDNPANPSQGLRCADAFDDGATLAPLLHLEFTTKYAGNPLPADGAVYTDTWVSLGWDAGETAVTHDVYMSDTMDDVTNGAAAAFQGNHALAFFFAGLGLPGDPYPSGLTPGTTYYWRVDEVEANGTTKYQGPVWSFSIPPRKAYNPVPPDGAYFTDLTTKLSWTAGFGAKLHTVYFGDNFDTVNNATQGGTPLGTTTFTPPGPLVLGKTYYWRVDEFDAFATYKGDVWSFATTIAGLGRAVTERWENISGTALSGLKSDPRYPNDPTVTETVTRFSWDGPDTDNYGGRIHGWLYVPATGDYTFWLNSDDNGELWLSTDEDPANISVIARETGYTSLNVWGTGEEQSQPIPLVGGEKYYIMALWKEGGGGDHCQVAWQGPGIATRTIIPGTNLSPYDPVNASGARPANGATGVSQNPLLQWKPGLQAASHEMYFGTDADAVKNATKTSPEYKGTRTLGAESYTPGTLGWETTYYWRIDEVNNVNPNSPWVGKVWSFTTADFGVVEDFESYNDIAVGQAGSNLVYLAWLDGYGTTTNGSTMGYPTGASLETTTVHGGAQSVPLIYSNSTASFSEVERTFAAQNWTSHGIQTLSLWFHGDATNVPGQLYVKINGIKVPYDGDASNLKREAWQTWNITLASVGVNLQSVTRLAVGIDNKGATGTLLLDDIRLYALPRQLITPVQPNPAGLIGHWRFDGNTQDSSGLGNHGTAGGGPTFVAGIVGSGAINLSGSGYVAIDGVVNDITSTNITLAAWIKTTQTTEGNVFSCNDSASGHPFILGVTNGNVWVEDNASTEFSAVNDDQWHLIAYVRNGPTGYIYLDGIQIGTDPASFSFGSVTRWSIGQEWDDATPSDFYVGAVDDARFYNYPLSEAEIAGLAGIALPFDKPL